MALTASERVVLIDERIATILSGSNQSVSINGRSFTRHDLGALRSLRKSYAAEAALAAGSASRGLRSFSIHHGGTVATGGQS